MEEKHVETSLAIAFCIGAAIGYLMPGGGVFLAILFGIICVAIAYGILYFIGMMLEKKQSLHERKESIRIQKELKNNTWRFPDDIFMDKCRSKRITNISTEEKYLKAKLLAEELLDELSIDKCYHDRYTKKEFLEPIFDTYNKAAKEKRDAEKREKLQELQEEEKQFEKICTRYCHLVGREKSNAICEDQIAYYEEILAACEKDEKAVRSGGEAVYLSGMQKESSWAIHGGIASGIAGTAAGIAVALDVANRNTKIRAYNDELRSTTAQLVVMELDRIWKAKNDAERSLQNWLDELDDLRVLLTENKDEKMLLRKINPTVINYEVTKTGAIKMQVKFCMENNLSIAGTPAVVDGSVKVFIKIGDVVVGSTICSLDYNGSYKAHTSDCICTSVAKKSKNYDFYFEPNHLWASEKRKPKVYW